MSFAIPTDQKTLLAFIRRRHPCYDDMVPHWDFCEKTYEGGRQWFDGNIFRYYKEGAQEYSDRLQRAYRFNHSREVVNLTNKYIFKEHIIRSDDAPDPIKQFWESASKSGLAIDDFMKGISTRTAIFGRIWIFVDNNAATNVITVADEKEQNAHCYAYVVKPQDMLDMGFDGFGKMQWCLVREKKRDDDNPFLSSGFVDYQYRLWMVDGWALFEIQPHPKTKGKYIVVMTAAGPNPLGEIPCFAADDIASDSAYTSPALINDIAYLDRAVANYLSNLDAIIQDQTFSQLAMPAQAMMPGEDKFDKLLEMGTKRIFLYDGESHSEPMYLSPDVRQASLILDVVNKIIAEIYHSVGMSGERTKQDNAVGIDNSSGVAKAYDFDKLNSMLASKADSLERIEMQLCRLVMLWNGKVAFEPNSEQNQLIKYPDNFDVRSLYDEFDVAERLSLIDAPESVRQEQMQELTDKLFPLLKKTLRDQMRTDIQNNWPKDPVEQAAAMAKATAPTLTLKSPGGNRQGQVTGQEQKQV